MLTENKMPHEPKLILIDINVLGISSMREWTYMGNSFNGKPTSAIQGTLDKLSRLLARYDDHVPVILWDDRCHWREEILASYKRHRWETPEQQEFLESYLAQAAVVRQLVGHLGISQIFCPCFEADDLAGVICRGIDPSWQVVLATSDSDWYQILRENLIWFSPLGERQVTLADLSDPDAIRDGPFDSTDHFIQSKALAGDSSDGIPGVRGVGIKTAARLIREHGSVENLWAKFDGGTSIKGVIQLRVAGLECRDVYRRNLRLVDWRLAPSLPLNYEFEMNAANREAFEEACDEWGITTGPRASDLSSMTGDHATSVAIAIEQALSAATAKFSLTSI